jgi:surfeit locus 1 family protein
MTLFFLFFLPLTLALGAWQLARAAEKEQLALRFFEGQAGSPVVASDALVLLPPYTRVRLRGHFDPERYFLLDNRTRAGRVGYEVIGVFHGDDSRNYLIDRGWVAAPPRREELPRVTVPGGNVEIIGAVALETGHRGAAEEGSAGRWPERIQWLNPLVLGASVDAVPRVIRLEPGAPGALALQDEAPEFRADRHYGYAVQWLGLAVALTALYVYYGLRRARSP